ncbi:hypothetical protein ACIQXF_15220 [Lysinibacillus sp. NPDC097231]|uniref:hypothetical protein n=1 Tax=Lysinibacillus sp. NPDC097231 TaxID=3364142 RepID=UPI00380F6731
MDNDIVKINDPIQLQQMIIFLRAELAKYKNEVKRLKESDYYSFVLRLERENVQLTNQKKELSMELLKLKRGYEKEAQAYYESIQAIEIQKKKQISSIEALLKEIAELRKENKLLKDTIKVTKDELLSVNSDAKYKTTIDGLENMLSDFTKDIGQQMETIIDAIERSRLEQLNSNNLNEYLTKEIGEKSSEIEKLSNELVDVKKQDSSLDTNMLSGKTILNQEVLTSLDTQVNNVLAQAIDFEEQLDQKLRILDHLEQKLKELAIDIDTKKN